MKGHFHLLYLNFHTRVAKLFFRGFVVWLRKMYYLCNRKTEMAG